MDTQKISEKCPKKGYTHIDFGVLGNWAKFSRSNEVQTQYKLVKILIGR